MQTFITNECEVAEAEGWLAEIAVLGVLVGMHHIGVADADPEVNGVGDGIVQGLTAGVTGDGSAVEGLANAHLS